jgi:filamentous hemagglutinin family protein
MVSMCGAGAEHRQQGLPVRWALLATVLGLLLATALHPPAALSQIVRDGSLGPPCAGAACALAGPNFTIGADLGQVVGNRNLFHSFRQLNVLTNQSATFSGPASIANIVSRVTGPQQSFIDGLLRSTISGANLFLLNPHGVVFGPNASLDVSGSFHVTSADYLRFADGAQFFADLSKTSTLSVTEPTAFGFLTATPAPIEIRGSTLQVPERQTLSIVGGDLTITPSVDGIAASLIAPGGRIQVASVGSPGEVVPSPPTSAPGLDVSGFSRLGRIGISASSLNVNEISPTGAGTVLIRGGQLFMDAVSVSANVSADVSGAQIGIDLRTTADMALTGGTSIGTTTSPGAARGGDIILSAGDLRLDGSSISTTALLGTGSAGNIGITAENLTVTNGGTISSQNIAFAPARGGNITIDVTGTVTVSAGAVLSASVFDGDGGDIAISARSLAMNAVATLLSGASGDGRGGAIGISVDRLSITEGSLIGSSGGASGPSGHIVLDARESALISGTDVFGNPSGIFSSSGGAPVGPIALTTGRLTLSDGARIQSGSILAARGGEITVRARDDVLIANRAGILSQTFDQPVEQVSVSARSLTLDDGFITTSTLGPGRAGAIAVDVGTLALQSGGQIVSSSELLAEGAGGSVRVTATGAVAISGRSPMTVPASPFGTDVNSGIFSTTAATGNAGQIDVNTPILTMDNGGKISVVTTGVGRAGSIGVNVEDLTMSGGARIDSGTTSTGTGGIINVHGSNIAITRRAGFFSNAEGAGPGGDINVTARSIQLDDAGTMSATSTGGADATAGSINIIFSNRLRLLNNSSITTDSLVADGGNITITSTGSELFLQNSQILTSVRSGVGSGGNITIGSLAHPLSIIVLDDGGIHADAFGGPGGNINVSTNVLLSNVPVETAITASSQLSSSGTISVNAFTTDVSGAVAELPSGLAQSAALLRASCAVRMAEGRASSLVVAGREGVPVEPGGFLPSELTEPRVARAANDTPLLSPIELRTLRLLYLDPKCGG